MKFTGRHRIQLLVFLLVAVVSVGYAGGSYAGLDRLLGTRGYTVTAQLKDSGGIFVNSEVSYRGVAIGTVTGMHLTAEGVDVELTIDDDAPRVPADTDAAVANRSAVGEQYLDLLPRNENQPYLEDGSVIRADRTSIPLGPETVLGNLDKLVTSIDPESLRTVVDETYDAFAGAGPDLQTLLDTAGSFTEAAKANLPQTQALLSDGKVVLQTQQRQSANILELSQGLRTIAERLKVSDPDLRRVIDEAPKVSRQVSDVLATSGADLGVVLANSLTTATITSARTDALEQTLVAYPIIAAFAPTTSPDGTGHLGFVVNVFDPFSCTKGYEGTAQRPANDLSEREPNKGAYCAEPPGSPTGVRGAQNAPYAGKPVEVAPPAPAPDQGARPPDGLPGLLGLPPAGTPPADLGQLLGLSG